MSLVASHISLSLSSKTILRDVSLSLKKGVFTSIVGPNGAGKSSLLKILSGDTKPTEGNVRMMEKALSSYSPKELAVLRAVLSQQLTVSFPFSVEEVIELSLHFHRLTRVEMNMIVNNVLKETGVDHLKGRLYPTLSGGESQRVQLARALAQIWENTLHPRFLMLDEPTNNLDLTHQHAIMYVARNMLKKNLGVLAIVHDLNLAAQYSDEIIFMKQGIIFAKGSPHDVMTREIIEDVFEHPVNVFYDDEERPFVMPLPHPNKFKQPIENTLTNGQLNYYS